MCNILILLTCFCLVASIKQSKHNRQTVSIYLQHINNNTMLNRLLDIFAPEYCIECGDEGSIWCEFCRLQHSSIPSRCFMCHKQTSDYQTCKSCYKKTGLKSVYIYGEYKDFNKMLIKALKFDCKRHACLPIANSMSEILPFYKEMPVLVPIPTSPLRVRQRGFDHTQAITKTLANKSQLTCSKLLIRTNDLRQVGSVRKDRLSQINGSFRLRNNKPLPKHVLLVDDVVTTGATLSEASKVLKQARVKRVEAIVFTYSK